MFRSLITLMLICFSAPSMSSSFEIRDYGDKKCQMGVIKTNQWKIDLTAKLKGESFDTYRKGGTSTFENNLHRAAKFLNAAVGQCLKQEQSESACKSIISAAKEWQEKRYLISTSPFDSPNWWEEAFQSSEFMLTMIEAVNIANSQLNAGLDNDKDLKKWLSQILHKNRKYQLTSNNHRTVWALAAAKTALLTGDTVKVGGQSKSAAELVDWELDFQFSMSEENGALPLEAIRGTRAIYYTGRQLGYLTALLEMGEKMGINAYDKYGNKLHRSVSFMLDAIDDAELIYPYAKTMKASPKGDPRTQDYGITGGEKNGTFSFLKVYVSRFPDHPNVSKIKKSKIVSPFVMFETKHRVKGMGIDLGCLNPGVEKVAAPKTIDFASLKARFACFMTEAESQNLAHLPTDEQINTLIEKVKESGKTQATRVDLTKYRVLDTMTRMEHMDPILNLLNFEGSLDEFCANPIDNTVVTAPSKF